MLKVNEAVFCGSFVKLNQLPEDNKQEIALMGRSNVGKSSLINKVLNRRKLAKSSSTPGKTRTMNYYMINAEWYFVDLPGYGYAKVSKSEQEKWGHMIEAYLKNRPQLRGVLHLMDIRHSPNKYDIMMRKWLESFQIPSLIIATKADKISRAARAKNLGVICKILEMPDDNIPLAFSAQTGEGVEEIKIALEEILN